MFAKVRSSTIIGIDAVPVCVEVDIANGLPDFHIVGLPDLAVKESAKRVCAAIKNSGYTFPSRRVTVNLAPANIKKEGPSFDLPIAVGILAAMGEISGEALADKVICGELSLDGELRPISGVLPRALEVRMRERLSLFVPRYNAREAAVVDHLAVYPVSNLLELTHILKGTREGELYAGEEDDEQCVSSVDTDYAEVKGHQHAKRGLEVAAAGGHNVLLIGPPGSGKTMLAKRLPTILSPMTREEALQTTRIHSVAGILPENSSLVRCRPFRSPHHTVSDAGLVGGGQYPRPGEISLAHNGVLFLDELPEFKRNVIEVLRQPLEEGVITISRAMSSITYPARFMFVAAMNPCPCGFFTDPKKECHCTPMQIQRYLSKISGPLLDRIDIHIEVPSLHCREMVSKVPAESSSTIRDRVLRAQEKQRERYRRGNSCLNAHLSRKGIDTHCEVSAEAEEMLKVAILELGLSARAYDKVLKIGRTIADLAGAEKVETAHIAEAIGYRALDKNLWKL